MTTRKAETYAEAKKRLWGTPVPEGAAHGQNSYAARYLGCDCKTCLPSGKRKWMHVEGAAGPQSHRERQQRLRAAKRGTPVPAGTKHGLYTYHVYNCRCAICKAAAAADSHEKRNRWRATAHGRWTTVGENETICWPPKDAGPDWVCPHPNHKEVA